jgi:molybdenum cofactor cytidylyltransferase
MAEAEGDALLVLPADMPFVKPETVRLLLDAFAEKSKQSAIVSPRSNGKRGHPVILPPALRDEIRAADPLLTLHDILKRHQDIRMDIEVDDRGVVRDVDRPEDLPGR